MQARGGSLVHKRRDRDGLRLAWKPILDASPPAVVIKTPARRDTVPANESATEPPPAVAFSESVAQEISVERGSLNPRHYHHYFLELGVVVLCLER